MEAIIALQAMEETAAFNEPGEAITNRTSYISVFSYCSSALDCAVGDAGPIAD